MVVIVIIRYILLEGDRMQFGTCQDVRQVVLREKRALEAKRVAGLLQLNYKDNDMQPDE